MEKKKATIAYNPQYPSVDDLRKKAKQRIPKFAFDYLDAPVLKIGAPNSIPPTSQALEKIFLPNAEKITKIIKTIF